MQLSEGKTKLMHPKVGDLRLRWDATALAAFMRDPLAYFWSYVMGYREHSQSLALVWGKAWDLITGTYMLALGQGEGRHRALEKAIMHAFEVAREKDLDTVAAGDKDGDKKNLKTLIRSIVWFDSYYHDRPEYFPTDSAKDIQRSVELELPFKTDDGLPFTYVVNFDQIAWRGSKLAIVERKSTSRTIGPYYYETYDPSVQINGYGVAGQLLFNEAKDTEIIVEACQSAVGFSRFGERIFVRNSQQNELWLATMENWIKLAERIARESTWYCWWNPASSVFNSEPRKIQRQLPNLWARLLDINFDKQPPWDPNNIPE